MKRLDFVVDFGTSYTKIFEKNAGLVLLEPTLVAVEQDGKKEKVFSSGYDAKNILGKTSDDIEVIAPLQNGVVKDRKRAIMFLKAMIKKVVDQKIINPKINIIFLTHLSTTVAEKAELKNIGYAIGSNTVEFLYAPYTSLINREIKKDQVYMSVVLGGGAIDIAVINEDKILTGETILFGGQDLDFAICRYIEEKFNLKISLKSAQKIKDNVASLYLKDNTSLELKGVSKSKNIPANQIVSAEDIYLVVKNFFDRIIKRVEMILNKSNTDAISDISQSGIFLSGGLANMPGILNYFKRKLYIPINISKNPEYDPVTGVKNLFNNKKKLQSILKENH